MMRLADVAAMKQFGSSLPSYSFRRLTAGHRKVVRDEEYSLSFVLLLVLLSGCV